jgi:hypothetical protein
MEVKKMFEAFKWLIEEMPSFIGRIVSAHLYDNGYVAIDMENRNGNVYQITITKKAGEEEDD